MKVMLKCASHTPLKGLYSPGKTIEEEVDAVLEKGRLDVEAFDPELVIIFATDHFNGLFYDLMPPFVIATAAESIGDFGTEPGPLDIPTDEANQLARHILSCEIDIAISHRLQVDHGCAQALQDFTGGISRYPVIPIVLNCAGPPLTPYSRIRKLGDAVGKWLTTLNKRVLIIGTGGLSHEPPIPRIESAPKEAREALICGRNLSPEARAAREARTLAAAKVYGSQDSHLKPLNPEWDEQFIELLVNHGIHNVDKFKVDDISREAGRSTHEIRTWVCAFAAIHACGDYRAEKIYYRPINEWICGYGMVSALGL